MRALAIRKKLSKGSRHLKKKKAIIKKIAGVLLIGVGAYVTGGSAGVLAVLRALEHSSRGEA